MNSKNRRDDYRNFRQQRWPRIRCWINVVPASSGVEIFISLRYMNIKLLFTHVHSFTLQSQSFLKLLSKLKFCDIFSSRILCRKMKNCSKIRRKSATHGNIIYYLLASMSFNIWTVPLPGRRMKSMDATQPFECRRSFFFLLFNQLEKRQSNHLVEHYFGATCIVEFKLKFDCYPWKGCLRNRFLTKRNLTSTPLCFDSKIGRQSWHGPQMNLRFGGHRFPFTLLSSQRTWITSRTFVHLPLKFMEYFSKQIPITITKFGIYIFSLQKLSTANNSAQFICIRLMVSSFSFSFCVG